jgi:hypothetical protein
VTSFEFVLPRGVALRIDVSPQETDSKVVEVRFRGQDVRASDVHDTPLGSCVEVALRHTREKLSGKTSQLFDLARFEGKNADSPIVPRRPRTPDEVLAAAAKLYADGATAPAIARDTGRPLSTVKTWIRKSRPRLLEESPGRTLTEAGVLALDGRDPMDVLGRDS